ncbi:MAG: peptide chain release factor N(5)-glutamine methyltransferase [Candidatus Omnitrophota bacterium]
MTESELVFSEVLGCSREQLYLNKKRLLTQKETSFLSDVLRRRSYGEPIQYILGKTEFMGMEFKLSPYVFIPRPETEILVQAVINLVTGRRPQAVCMDIGTGSGNIAVSLAKLLKDCEVLAVDISPEAIAVAKYNSLINGVAGKVNFINQDFLGLKPQSRSLFSSRFDLIVSNPPYIPSIEIKGLQPELSYEPRVALDGGINGLGFYHHIVQDASVYLKKNGFLIMEMGFNQCPGIKEIFDSIGKFQIIDVVKDYNNIDRVIVAKKQVKNPR